MAVGPEFWAEWSDPVFEPFVDGAWHRNFVRNIPTHVEFLEDFADEVLVLALADAFEIERVGHNAVGVWRAEFDTGEFAGVGVRVVASFGFKESQEAWGIHLAIFDVALVRPERIDKVFEDFVRLDEGPAIDKFAEGVVAGQEVAVATVDTVGGFAENKDVAAVFLGLLGSLVDLDFDRVLPRQLLL